MGEGGNVDKVMETAGVNSLQCIRQQWFIKPFERWGEQVLRVAEVRRAPGRTGL